MSHSPDPGGAAAAQQIDYEAFQARSDFQDYKHGFRRFVFPLTVAFMVWFLLYVVLAAYAHDFMAKPFLGFNVGLWFGLSQFVTTFAITMWYVSFANRRLDPASERLRSELEQLERAAAGTETEPDAGTGTDTEGGAQ